MASRKAVAFLLANPDIAKAYVEGKPIQFRPKERKYGEEWTDWDITQELIFNERYEYRLKPEPQTWYVVVGGLGDWWSKNTNKATAERDLVQRRAQGTNGPYVLKEFREVLQ